jgi:hypothetical protein
MDEKCTEEKALLSSERLPMSSFLVETAGKQRS